MLLGVQNLQTDEFRAQQILQSKNSAGLSMANLEHLEKKLTDILFVKIFSGATRDDSLNIEPNLKYV